MIKSIELNDDNAVYSPLWYHKRGLMQTASGYGRKLVTEWKIEYNNRLYRIYLCIFSNSGTLYIRTKNGDIYIDDYRINR